MAAEAAIVNATKALRPLRDQLSNHYVFEEAVKKSLSLLYEKYVEGQNSLERALRSQIEAAPLLEGELKIWLQMIDRRLRPQMKVRNGWMLEFRRAMPLQVFTLILEAIKKARSTYGVTCKEEKLITTISYDRENRLIRDLSVLSQISRESVREFFTKKSKGKRKGTSEVVINSESPFSICFVKRTQQVVVRVHYKFINEYGYTFS